MPAERVLVALRRAACRSRRITAFTSALCSVNTPADMPVIQSMSNIAIVSIRCAQLALGARQDQEVAQVVDAHRLRVLRERLDQPQHLAHADVAQRDDLHREAGRQRATRCCRAAASRCRARPRPAARSCRCRPPRRTIVAPFIRSSVSSVDGSALARDAGRRADRHLPADGRVDRVALRSRMSPRMLRITSRRSAPSKLRMTVPPGSLARRLSDGGGRRRAAGPAPRRRCP